MGFPRQEFWSGLPFPSPWDLPRAGIEPVSPALAEGLYHQATRESPWFVFWNLSSWVKQAHQADGYLSLDMLLPLALLPPPSLFCHGSLPCPAPTPQSLVWMPTVSPSLPYAAIMLKRDPKSSSSWFCPAWSTAKSLKRKTVRLIPLSLMQCLAMSRHSINLCRMNEGNSTITG